MERVVLSKGLTTWMVSYYDLKGVQHIIATFTDGPLQNRLMVTTARDVAKAKLIETVTVEADPASLDKLYKRVPQVVDAIDRKPLELSDAAAARMLEPLYRPMSDEERAMWEELRTAGKVFSE